MKTIVASVTLAVTAVLIAYADDLRCTSTPIVHAYEGKEAMRGCIISDSESVIPGKPFTVGLLLRLQPGWHAYSSAPGDAGISTSITWELPSGFTATPLHCPPAKTVNYGEIRCNVFDNEVLLMSVITPPKTIQEDTVLIQANVQWGCDSDQICLMPVESNVALRLKRGDTPSPVNAELFTKHRALVQE